MAEIAPSTEADPGSGSGVGTDADAGAGAEPWTGLPTLARTTGITTFGHLAWIGWVWLAVGVIVSGIAIAIGAGAYSELTESLWEDAAAGWQRWLLLGAGVATTSTFAPMLVGNGVTRARLSASVTVTMVALAVICTLFIVAGYLVEGVVFRLSDAAHVLGDDGRTIGGQVLAGLAVRHAITLAAYFASGWLIGIGFYRFGRELAIVLILPSVVPAALVELLLIGGTSVSFAPLDGMSSGPPLAVGAPASVVAIAVAALVARRYTRDLVLTE